MTEMQSNAANSWLCPYYMVKATAVRIEDG